MSFEQWQRNLPDLVAQQLLRVGAAFATEDVPGGVLVCGASRETSIKLPSTGLEVSRGLGVAPLTSTTGQVANFITKGAVWVLTEGYPALYSPCFVRFAGVGQRGAFRSDNAGGQAALLGRACFSSMPVGGYAEVFFNN